MSFSVAPGAGTTAGRRARRAWIALHVDAGQSIVLAGSALMLVLALAIRCFEATGDRSG